MAEDFYENFIKGFAQGLGLGERGRVRRLARREKTGRLDEIAGLFAELINEGETAKDGASEGGAPLSSGGGATSPGAGVSSGGGTSSGNGSGGNTSVSGLQDLGAALQNPVTGVNSAPETAAQLKKKALLAALSPAVFKLYEKQKEAKRKTLKFDEQYIYYTDNEGNRTWLTDGNGEKIKNNFWKPKIVDRFNEYKDGKPRRVYLYEDGSKVFHDLEMPPPVKTALDPIEYEEKLLKLYKEGKISLKDYQTLKEKNRKRLLE